MGGDHAPEAIVAGAALAVRRGFATPGQVLLAGDPDKLIQAIEAQGCRAALCDREELPASLPPLDGDAFGVVRASQTVAMHESARSSLRQKKDSSLTVATRLVKEGMADALCSAGNTGASVAAAMLNLKSLEGVHRPGIAVNIEGEAGPFTILDVGANIFPKPLHLLHYGIMGRCLQQKQFGKEDPTVGLVNIGGEEGKGTQLAKETQELFRAAPIRFVGNVEGQDVFRGAADVLVTDGFVGNVILKLTEGLATHLLQVIREELVEAGVRPEVLEVGLARITQRSDYSEYGGALLLGVEGIVTIAHGRSNARAIANAIRVSGEAVQTAVNQEIVEEIRRLGPTGRVEGTKP